MINIRHYFPVIVCVVFVAASCRKQNNPPTYPDPIQKIIDSYFIPFIETENKSDFGRYSLSTKRSLISNEIVSFISREGWEVSQTMTIIHATRKEGDFTYEIQIDTSSNVMDIHIFRNHAKSM